VFCLPSVTAASGDAEGLPISILEALASGVPVVATRHAGIPEAVVDRECGFLVDERDVQALADRLSLLLASDTMRNEFALSARKRAEERFDLETNTAELENLYAKVGGRSGHRPSVRGARPHSANAARLPTVLQVCRHIADGGGVSGVAANVERQLVALGYTCRRLTADDMRTFVPKAFRDRRIGLAIEILAFSVRATLTLKRRSVDVNEVIIVHNDALGGDIYVNHGLHKARMKQRGVWATLRNPLHVFLLAREELRHRVPSHRAVVCLSAAVRARLMSHYPVSPDLVSVIPNGVDIDFYAPLDPTLRARAREGWDLTSNDFVLLFVGKEFERKGLAIALEAMSQLPSSVMLWVVGGATATTKKWRDATKQLGLEDRVRFYGPRSDVREFYQRADAFVLPSKFEASPLVSLEAMATGLPCLLTSGAGADDYLDSEHNGLHVTSACDIARQVSRLQSDPILRADLSRAARQTALEFSWTAVARKYADLITRVSQTRGDAHDRHGNR
jgi:UDP-glucose:(heptosyl)LPS alpha-1,3-glucosyltransferase